MHEGLRRRVRQLEQRSGMDSKYVLVPLPGHPGQFFRLPRPFAEFLVKKDQERRAAGGYFNLTDGKWIEMDDDDGIRQNPTK